jgi:hypothetical protein
MNLSQIKAELEAVRSTALSELRSAVPGDFKFWMDNRFYFYDDKANRYGNLMAGGGGKQDGYVYLYGTDQDTGRGLIPVLDDQFDVEEPVTLLDAYKRRDEPPDELKGIPELPDQLGPLIIALVGEDVAYYVKIALGERERVLGPFGTTRPPPLKISQLRGCQLWYRKASEDVWNEIAMHF